MLSRPLAVFLSSGVWVPLAFASLTNFTIDDQNGDPSGHGKVTYSPSNQWSFGPTCSDCLVHLDKSQTNEGTWHDTTFHTSKGGSRSFQLQFTGTAIYVFNALANTLSTSNPTTTSLVFTLDGEDDGSFLHTPSSSTDFEYNVLVYSHEGLSNVEHKLIVQASPEVDSVILFDYAMYTVVNGTDSGSKPSFTTLDPSGESSTTTTSTPSSGSTGPVATTTSVSSSFPSIFSSRSSIISRSSTISRSSYSSLSTSLFTQLSTANPSISPSAPTNNHRPPAGLVAGVTIAGILLFGMLAVATVWLLRRLFTRAQKPGSPSTPKGDEKGLNVTPYPPYYPRPIVHVPSSVIPIGNPNFSSLTDLITNTHSWVTASQSSSLRSFDMDTDASSTLRAVSMYSSSRYPFTSDLEAAIASSELLARSSVQGSGQGGASDQDHSGSMRSSTMASYNAETVRV